MGIFPSRSRSVQPDPNNNNSSSSSNNNNASNNPADQPHYYLMFGGPPLVLGGNTRFFPQQEDTQQFYVPRQPAPPPPPVQKTVKVKSDVNLDKNTLRLVHIEGTKYLLQFVVDLADDCRVTLHFGATETIFKDTTATITYEDIDVNNNNSIAQYSRMNPFLSTVLPKGSGQLYQQSPESPLDVSRFQQETDFEIDTIHRTNRYPIIVQLDVLHGGSTSDDIDDNNNNNNNTPSSGLALENRSQNQQQQQQQQCVRSQFTFATLVRNMSDGTYSVKVLKQKIQIDGKAYDIHEIYGLEGNIDVEDKDDDSDVALCVICISEPREITLLPCRHMCLCGGCAKVLRLQANAKCPICRTVIESLLQISSSRSGGGDMMGIDIDEETRKG